MLQHEILAPCGSMESIYAAVRCGADAVYFGAKNFNARRNGENFDDSQLLQAIRYCHARGVKVHITLNTLIGDDEIEDALDEVKLLCKYGADAIIVQDIGLSSLIRKHAPQLEMHASTQMSVQTAAGINLLMELGFSTAVLPRELTKREIEKISRSTDMRLEAFVHGALCMSVSGQCYLSAFIGSRSGNRGLCAQPCRLPFSAKGGTGNDLSLKDLSLIEKADELCASGASLLKIEGRMKRPEYVAAAVTSLRNSLDGRTDKRTSDALSAVFSRSGFTSGYFDNKRGRNMFGIRTKDDVVSADKSTLKFLQSLFEKEKPVAGVDFTIRITDGQPVTLTAESGEKSVSVTGGVPQKAIRIPLSEEAVKDQLSKCGGTMFFAESIAVFLDKGLSVPLSELNGLRRSALSALEEKLSAKEELPFIPYVVQKRENRAAVTHPSVVARFSEAKQIPEDLSGISAVIAPLEMINDFKEITAGKKLIAEIPRGIFHNEDEILNRLIAAKENGTDSALCSTLDGIALAIKAGMKIHGGFSLNVFNSESVHALEKLNAESLVLSPELKLQQANRIEGSVPLGIIVYGRLPLMLMRNCPVKNGTDCTKCGKTGCLTDRMGISFPVRCSNGCSELLNSVPIYLGDKKEDIKTDFIMLYFTLESANEAAEIINKYKTGSPPPEKFTRGLYYRGVK